MHKPFQHTGTISSYSTALLNNLQPSLHSSTLFLEQAQGIHADTHQIPASVVCKTCWHPLWFLEADTDNTWDTAHSKSGFGSPSLGKLRITTAWTAPAPPQLDRTSKAPLEFGAGQTA